MQGVISIGTNNPGNSGNDATRFYRDVFYGLLAACMNRGFVTPVRCSCTVYRRLFYARKDGVSKMELDREKYLELIIGSKAPEMLTTWQAEILIGVALHRAAAVAIRCEDKHIAAEIVKEITDLDLMSWEKFIPTAADGEDCHQWNDAITVKRHYFPSMILAEEEREIPAKFAD